MPRPNPLESLFKRIKPQSFDVYIPIYEQLIDVVIGESELERLIKLNPDNKHMQVVYEDCSDGDTGGYHYASGSYTMLYLGLNINTELFSDFMKVMSHEIRHAVDNILYQKGIPFVPDTANEAYTYLQGYMTKMILQKIKFR